MNPKVKILVRCILFILCLVVVIKGHQLEGRTGVGVMLVGLTGLLTLLWAYNRPYSKS